MVETTHKIDVYLEVGEKKTFAGAVEWPGWCRSGRDAEAALQALCEYGPRYARALRSAGLEFQVPDDVSSFNLIEQLEGNATTDFGAPAIPPSGDGRPVDEAKHLRLRSILEACWTAFDAAVRESAEKELRKGPRGGGRDLEKIVSHVLGAEAGYLKQLGGKSNQPEPGDPQEELDRFRQAILEALAAAVRGEIPARGPRGGVRWTPRYFVRREAWHVLDHAWEIEDRSIDPTE